MKLNLRYCNCGLTARPSKAPAAPEPVGSHAGGPPRAPRRLRRDPADFDPIGHNKIHYLPYVETYCTY